MTTEEVITRMRVCAFSILDEADNHYRNELPPLYREAVMLLLMASKALETGPMDEVRQ